MLFVHNDEGPKVAHWAKEILRPCMTDVPLTSMEDEVGTIENMESMDLNQTLDVQN